MPAFDQFQFGYGGGSPLSFADTQSQQAPASKGGLGSSIGTILSAASSAYTNFLIAENQSNAAKYGYQVGAVPGTTADFQLAQAGVGGGLISMAPAGMNPQIVYAVLAVIVVIALAVVFKKK